MRLFGRSGSAATAAIQPAYSVLNLNKDPVTEGQNFAADYFRHMTDPRIGPLYFGTAIEDYLKRQSPSPNFTVKFVDATLQHAKENNPHLKFSVDTNSILREVHGSWNFFGYKARGYLQGLRGRRNASTYSQNASEEASAEVARQNKFASWLASSKESAGRFLQRAWYGDVMLTPDDEYARTLSEADRILEESRALLDSLRGRDVSASQRGFEATADVADNLPMQPEIQEYVGRAKESLLKRGTRGFNNLRTGLANKGFNRATVQRWMSFRERVAAPFYRLGRTIDYGLDRAAAQQQIFDSYLQRTVNREKAGKILENTRTKLSANARRAGEKIRTFETQAGEAMAYAGNSLFYMGALPAESIVYQRTETERPGFREKAKNYVSRIRERLAERRKREEERQQRQPRERKSTGEYFADLRRRLAQYGFNKQYAASHGFSRQYWANRGFNEENWGKRTERPRKWWGRKTKTQKGVLVSAAGAAGLAVAGAILYYFVPDARESMNTAWTYVQQLLGGAPTTAPTAAPTVAVTAAPTAVPAATPTLNIFAQNLPDAREWVELAQRRLLETYETPRNAVEVLNELVQKARDAGLNLDGDNVKRLADALWKMNGLGNNDNMIHVAPRLEALQLDKWLTGGH